MLKKDLTNQSFLRTLSADTHPGYTRIWLSAKLSATESFHCCSVLCFLPSQKMLGFFNQWTVREISVGYILESCTKILSLVDMTILQTQAVKSHHLYLSVSLDIFWCLEKPLTFFPKKELQYGRFKINRGSILNLYLSTAWNRIRSTQKVLIQRLFAFCRIMSSRMQNVWVLTCWKDLCLKSLRLFLLRSFRNHSKRVRN